MNEEKRTRLAAVLENAFLLLTAFYLLHMTETVTMLGWNLPRWGSLTLLLLMAAAAGPRLLLLGLKRPQPWIAAGIAGVCLAIYLKGGYAQFLFLAVLTAGFVDIDYRKALRLWLITVGCAFLLIVALCLLGRVEDLTFLKRGHLRHSGGYIYPTDFASLLLFLLLFLWVLWRKLPDWAGLLLAAGAFGISYFVAYSWTSMICTGLFLLAALIHMVYGREKPGKRPLRGVLDWLLALALPLSLLLALWLLWAMGRGIPWVLRLDQLMSGRLSLSRAGFDTYGVHPFGSAFPLIGNGATDGNPAGYNFIDNAYHLVLVRYGWVLLALLTLEWPWLTRRAVRAGDRRLALALALIAVHALSEHHLIEAHYVLPLVLPLAAFPGRDAKENAPTGAEAGEGG